MDVDLSALYTYLPLYPFVIIIHANYLVNLILTCITHVHININLVTENSNKFLLDEIYSYANVALLNNCVLYESLLGRGIK